MLVTTTHLLFIFAGCILLVGGVWVASRRLALSALAPTQDEVPSNKSRFLFRAGLLIDANPAALQICAETPVEVFDWSTMHAKMVTHFPDFPPSQGASQVRDVIVLHAEDPEDRSVLTIDQWDDVARIILEQDSAPDTARRTAIMQAMFQAPNPVWKSSANGHVIWRNSAYKELVASLGYQAKQDPVFDVGALRPGDPSKRLQVKDAQGETTRWFDVTAVQTGAYVMYYASEADAVVSALDAQRSFVQIFSKTFAHLSTGLVIFDKDQLLILFNPALLELTGLSADFLSKRCDAKSFFDQLREMQVLPDVSSHRSWAKQVDDILLSALEGHYSETWTLPTGVTYRVTGRPHPDGALVFLFEDITAEITVTRRFRTELSQCHSVLDTIETALVLFSSTGQVQLCNDAYRKLWKTDPDSSFAQYALKDAILHWQGDCLPSEVWPNLQDRILSNAMREPWQTALSLTSGEGLRMSVTPITGGMTLVAFDPFSSVLAPQDLNSWIDQNT